MALNEEVILPVSLAQMEEMKERSHGFVSAKLGIPFSSTETRIVSQAELANQLEEMIAEVKDIGRDESSWLDGLLRSGSDRLITPFVQLLSRRILGLYAQSYKSDKPGKLLLVGENIANVASELDLDTKDFFLWVMIHETMHVAQFNAEGSLLRSYIKEQIEKISQGGKDSKKVIRDAGAAMTWIEGSADAIMDEPGLLRKEDIAKMREKVDAKRSRVTWSSVLLQILTKKNSQYREGRRLVEEMNRIHGSETMTLPILDPSWLPSKDEIAAPSLWLQRYEKSLRQEQSG